MERLITIEQLSEIIQVSPSTVYHWVQVGYIPHYKFPKGLRFKVSEIDTWLKRKHISGRVKYFEPMEVL